LASEGVDAPLRVIELFAGTGGFRLGLEGLGTCEHPRNPAFKVVWSNQWEPSTKRQHASEVYAARWGSEGHTNEDIFSVVSDPRKFESIVSAKLDMLVAGFPCQDYSVAKPADKAAGIQGKKGVLWWAIHGVLKQLQDAGQPVKYLLLENVDRLLKSPTANRGRDFAIILSSLAALGYAVEWRVVNAADYGFPQRRKRVFLVAYHCTTALYRRAVVSDKTAAHVAWLTIDGVLPKGLPATYAIDGSRDIRNCLDSFDVGRDPLAAQADYSAEAKGGSRFKSGGLMHDGKVWTADLRVHPSIEDKLLDGQLARVTLGDVVGHTADVPDSHFLTSHALPRWVYLKGGKSAIRTAANGHEYKYSEGPVTFPDALDRASRTIITGEGGSAPSRFKHVVKTADGRLRRLTSEELEELNGFPRGFTRLEGVSDVKRAFLMGNALVVGVVRAIGSALAVDHREAEEQASVHSFVN